MKEVKPPEVVEIPHESLARYPEGYAPVDGITIFTEGPGFKVVISHATLESDGVTIFEQGGNIGPFFAGEQQVIFKLKPPENPITGQMQKKFYSGGQTEYICP